MSEEEGEPGAGAVVPEWLNIGIACTDVRHRPWLADQTALVFTDETDRSRELCYGDLARLCERFASLLSSQDLSPGDRVLLKLPNTEAFPIAFFGALRAGLIAVPLSTQLTLSETAFIAEDSGARAMVCTAMEWAKLAKDASQWSGLSCVILIGDRHHEPLQQQATGDGTVDVLFWDDGERITETSVAVQTRSEDPAYLVYTSGTTGKPKGVLHAHRSLYGRLPAAHDWFDWQADRVDRVLHSGRFNWTYVLGSALMDPLFQGQTVIVHEGASTPTVWPDLIARHQATVFIGVPAIYRRILEKTDATRADVPTLRHCMSAGEALQPSLLEAWQARFGQPIYEALGMTEVSYYVSNGPRFAVVPGCVGRPQPGRQVSVLDPLSKQEQPTGTAGIVAVGRSDPGLFLRYWGEVKSEEVMNGGWFVTGDFGRFDQDGRLWLIGRHDDQINSFGHRISPGEVESVLSQHPAVADCACCGQAQSGSAIVVAYVVVRPGHGVDTGKLIHALLQHATARLARYKVPRQFYIVSELPRTPNGKIQRRLLSPERAARTDNSIEAMLLTTDVMSS